MPGLTKATGSQGPRTHAMSLVEPSTPSTMNCLSYRDSWYQRVSFVYFAFRGAPKDFAQKFAFFGVEADLFSPLNNHSKVGKSPTLTPCPLHSRYWNSETKRRGSVKYRESPGTNSVKVVTVPCIRGGTVQSSIRTASQHGPARLFIYRPRKISL